MSNGRVSLHPVRAEDLALLDRFLLEPETTGPFEWLGWIDPHLWRRQWENDRLQGDDGGKLMVFVESDPVGFVGWQKVATSRTEYCWNISIALLPEARGHGHGSQAHRLLVAYLFTHSSLHRIEADTDAANVAERRALENAGFVREEILRGHLFRDGRRHDSVLYGLLREDHAFA